MLPQIPVPPRLLRPSESRETPSPLAILYDVTMAGGTALIGTSFFHTALTVQRTENYETTWTDIILEYERTITDLRRELLHYQSLVTQLLGPIQTAEEYDHPTPVIAVDATSTRVVNSIIQARIPASATFRDFEEGEL
jgi:hypothetical protein